MKELITLKANGVKTVMLNGFREDINYVRSLGSIVYIGKDGEFHYFETK